MRSHVSEASRRTFVAAILIIAVFNAAYLYAQDAAPSAAAVVAATGSEAAPKIGAAAAPPAADPDVAEPDSISLLVGKSAIVKVGRPIQRVSLTSADIADALVTSPSELLINGKAPGTISMFVWDRSGGLRRYEIVVQRDIDRLAAEMKRLLPNEPIEVQGNGRNAVLSGTVSTKDVVERAISLASGFVEKKEEVISLLQVGPGAPTNQVLLRVRFAEVSRSALTELGMGLFTSPTGIQNNIGRITTQQFPSPDFSELTSTKASSDFGSAVTTATGKFTFSDFLNLFLYNEKYDLGAVVKALQSRGLFQSLAEPNLVAESGKEASFLAGGEFPIPIAQGSGGNLAITVQFKEFGVRLTFTPTVNNNRISLKVRPEVSTLDFSNAVVLNGFRIPALTTRRTETELELDNHQTFAIAGLLNNSMTSTMQKIPGVGDVPILGLLFKSKAAQKDQTELVVMITPEILPQGSNGVTPNLPRQQEPYLPAMPQNNTVPPPPPAFQGAVDAGAPPVADRKTLERAQKEAAKQQQAELRAQAEEAKRAARQAESDRKKEQADQERQTKVAREQAKREAQAARASADVDKRQSQ